MKTRQMGAIPPSAILSRKGIAPYGGVSRTGPLSEISNSRLAGAITAMTLQDKRVGDAQSGRKRI